MTQPRTLPTVPALTARGVHGAVVSPHALATQAGISVLRAGGTAVDAAIATNAALAVVSSYACGLGGDAFWLVWPGAAADAATGSAGWPGAPSEAGGGAHAGGERRLVALNGSGRSARGATIEAARAAGLTAMPLRGPWTVTVPGAVRSWGDAHARFGRLPWPDLLAPAIELAGGFPASPTWSATIEGAGAVFGTSPGGWSDWAATFRPHGRPWRVGERVRLPALERTLRTLAADGPAAPYTGALAARAAAYLESAGSPIRDVDLADHASTWAEPIRTTYRGVESWTHPPNSCGAIALELLNVLSCFDPPPAWAFGAEGVSDVAWIHVALEAARLGLADRDRFLTDPDAMAADALETLLDRDHAADLAARIPLDARLPVEPRRGPAGGGTIYLAAADRWGGLVSLIESNYAGFGSGLVDPGTGIAYQNRGSFFSLDPSHTNALRPGRRTMHTLTPGMLFRDGRPWIVHGSMGGEIQPQVFAQFVSAGADMGADIATAVAAPRFAADSEAHYGPPSITRLEGRMPDEVARGLAALGHRIDIGGDFDSGFGHEHAIELVREPGQDPGASPSSYAATTDPRSEGIPAAF